MIHTIIVGGLYTKMVVNFMADAKKDFDNYTDTNIDSQNYYLAFHSKFSNASGWGTQLVLFISQLVNFLSTDI